MLDELLALRQGDGPLAGLGQSDLEHLAAELERVSCAPSEVLIRAGDSGDRIYVVLSGKLRRIGAPEGSPIEVGPGGVLGGVVLMAGGEHSVEVQAVDECRLLAIRREALDRLRSRSPEAWRRVSALVSNYMRKEQLAIHLTRICGPLDSTLLDELEAETSWLTLTSGERLFREGDEADSIFVVMHGRLHVSTLTPGGDEEVVNEVGRGEPVGEMAALTNETRSASVFAVRDTELARISRAGFERLIQQRPESMRRISQIIVERLRRHGSPDLARRLPPEGIAVIGAEIGQDVRAFVEELAAAMERHGTVRRLNSKHVDDRLGKPGISQAKPGEPSYERLMPWLQDREERFDYLVYAADPEWTPWSERCVRQADVVLVVADGDASKVAESPFLARLQSGGHGAQRIALVLSHLSHPSDDKPIRGTAKWLDAWPVREHYHLSHGCQEDLDRIARCVVGKALGLVLGGGAARGFAHVGIYRALKEAGIAIDVVAGSSIGATFAAGIAAGWEPDHLTAVARNSFVDINVLNDYTIPVVSLIKGKKLDRMAQRHLGIDIEDLELPFFCVSTNLSRGEMVVFDRGPTWKAIRASVALPGVLPPAVDGNSLLIDGGILNNLPIDLMRARYDIGQVIAVDLHIGKEYELPYTEVPSASQVLRSRWLPFTKRLRVPGLVTLMMKATEISSIVHAKRVRRQADLWLNPPVGDFGILEVKSFDRIVEVGYRYAQEHIAAWLESDRA